MWRRLVSRILLVRRRRAHRARREHRVALAEQCIGTMLNLATHVAVASARVEVVVLVHFAGLAAELVYDGWSTDVGAEMLFARCLWIRV